MRLTLGICVVVGCGRVGFDPQPIATTDATTDARNDGAPPAFCASLTPAPELCSDFDEGGGLAGWDIQPVPQAGAISVVLTGGLSPPGDLVVSSVVVGPTGTAGIEIGHSIVTAPVTDLIVGFDVTIDQIGSSDPILVALIFVDPVQDHVLNYVHRLPSPYLEEVVTAHPGAPAYNSYPIASGFSSGWHRIELDLSLAPSSATVRLDGALVATQALVAPSNGSASVHFGMPYLGGPATPWQFRFDNVVVNTH